VQQDRLFASNILKIRNEHNNQTICIFGMLSQQLIFSRYL
jgi:hypothetical protein